MTPKEFEDIAAEVFITCNRILNKRKLVYSSGGDRLGNFKRAAQMTKGETPAKALVGMLKKQFVSILDYVDGNIPVDMGDIEEKIYDSINYLVLLMAIILEERGWTSGTSITGGYVSELGQTQDVSQDKLEQSS